MNRNRATLKTILGRKSRQRLAVMTEWAA